MATKQRSQWCRNCEKKTLHQKEVFSGSMGCLLSLVTCGLFIPFWIASDVLGLFKSYRCQNCGKAKFL